MSTRNWPLATLTASLLVSQATAAADTARRGGEEQLDTVVVTGERIGPDLAHSTDSGALGARSLLDTPFSISMVDATDIALRQASSLQQIFFNDPSVFSASTSATTNWWGPQMRGMGVNNYYIDGVPMLLNWGGEFPLEAVETVEALKGLAGFMYGFGSPGGVLKYRTKRPTDSPLFRAGMTWRNDSALAGSLDAGGRAGAEGSFGYRLNLGAQTGEHYNTTSIDRRLASLALDYRLLGNLQWHASVVHEDNRIKHEPMYLYWDKYEDEALPSPTYDYGNLTVDGSWYDTETLLGTTGLAWQIDEAWRADFTLGASRKLHRANKMFAYLVNEAGDYHGTQYNFAGLLKNHFAQAIVQGTARTGALRHDLAFGTTVQRAFDRWSNDWYWNDDGDFTGNLYQPQGYALTRTLDFSLAPLSFDERQLALFASDTLHFGAHWQAILGLRYTDYRQKDLDGDPETDSGYRKKPLTPTVALVYKPIDSMSVYGSYVESLEAGSRVSEPYANAGQVLDPTVSRQYEIGAKYEASRVVFTTAAFRIERAAEIDVEDGEDLLLVRDGLTRYQGIEAMGNFSLAPRLQAGLGLTYLDARIEDVSAGNPQIEGNRPGGAARWQLAGNIDYALAAVPGLGVHAAARYFGNAYYSDSNQVLLPARTLVSVGAQYDTSLGGHKVVVTGNINNLFNRKYWELNTLGEGINGALGVTVEW